MPGNRAIFDRAMEAHRNAAQRDDWMVALKEALRAVQEFSNDLDARAAVAVGLYHNGKYAQSAQLLEELRKRRGADAHTLAYLARAYEGSNQLDLAVQTLLALAEQSLAQRRFPDAVDALEEATRIVPDREDVRIRLAEVFVEMGDTRRAAAECVEIARVRQARGDDAGALEALTEALGLDAGNRAAQALRLQLADHEAAAEVAAPAELAVPSLPQGSGPLHDPALQLDQLIARAGQQQAAGDREAALQSYEHALELGSERNDVFYSLGLLLHEKGEYTRAAEYLRRAAAADEYAMSAYFALGQTLKAAGQPREAAEQFEVTIRLVDLETINRAEADDLVAMYEAAGECYTELGELSRAASLYGALSSFFGGKRWGKDLSEQFKARAKELTERSMFAKLRAIGTGALPGEQLPPPPPEAPASSATQVWGALPSLSDFLKGDGGGGVAPNIPFDQQIDPFAALNLPEVDKAMFAPVTPISTEGQSDMVARYLAASERFIDQGLMYAAVDACHEIVRLDPEFLPIHLRLGEIYEREGRNEDALLKYRTVVDTYVSRGKETEAIDVYYRLIELSPDTITARSKLADLLRKAERTDEAVDQALLVANNFFRMGQTNRALEEFRRVQQWAPKSAAIHKEYGQALLKLERWEAALTEFRQAVVLDGSDPVALGQLNITLAVLAQQERAVWDSLAALLDKLRADAGLVPSVQSVYRTALLINDTPILHYILGLIQQVGSQHASAMLSFEQALSLLTLEEHPLVTPLLVHQALAESYIAEDQAQEAIDQLHTVSRLLREQPGRTGGPHAFARPLTEAELQRRLAAALAGTGDWAGAIQALNVCLQTDPTDFAAYTQLADIYFRQGKLAEALQQYEKLATVYEERQQLDQAIAALQDATKLAPSSTIIRSRLAQLLIRRGLIDEGLRELQEVAILQKNTGHLKDAVLAMQQSADIYWMLGQHDKVYRVYDQIVAIAPTDIEARQQLVNLYLLSGRHDAAITEQRRIAQISQEQRNWNEALSALHQIIALDPNDVLAHEQMGGLLMNLKEFEQAVRMYRRLVRLRPNDEHAQALQSAAERMLMLKQDERRSAK